MNNFQFNKLIFTIILNSKSQLKVVDKLKLGLKYLSDNSIKNIGLLVSVKLVIKTCNNCSIKMTKIHDKMWHLPI